MKEKKVLIGEVAEIFGVTPQTIRNWTRKGVFTEYRTLGGHRRFSLKEVEKNKKLSGASSRKVSGRRS